jgi:DNA-binding MarR family transcriptional regulator
MVEHSKRDPFTSDRFRWWDTLAADPDMPPAAFIVGYVIGTELKRNSGNKALVSDSNGPDDVVCEAWIGAGKIADRISMSPGTVFAAIKKLEQHGYIQVDKGKAGSGHSHHYRLVEKGQPADLSENKKGQRAHHSNQKGQPADYSEAEKVSGLTNKGQPADMNPSDPLKEIPIEERDSLDHVVDQEDGRRPKGKPQEKESDPLDAAFEEWWVQYPKKVDKPKARAAYRCVLTKKLATVEDLMAGVLRYGAERSLKNEPRFTKHPTNWLNAESWNNEPDTPIARYYGGGGPQQRDQFLEALGDAATILRNGGVQ